MNRISIPKGIHEIAETQDCVKVHVGSGESGKLFVVKRTLLCGASDYCRRRFAAESKCRDESIFLNDFRPLNFQLFFQWISNPAPTIIYDPDGLPQEPWLSNAATTWLLGKKLQCSVEFDRYALSQFIQNCAFMAFGPWELIEKEANQCSLSRFSDHWIAWNHRLAGPGRNEYSGLRAASNPVVPTRDPRTFDIDHWYSECGKYLLPKCLHDPIARLERTEEANRPKPIPPVEWGSLEELRH